MKEYPNEAQSEQWRDTEMVRVVVKHAWIYSKDDTDGTMVLHVPIPSQHDLAIDAMFDAAQAISNPIAKSLVHDSLCEVVTSIRMLALGKVIKAE